MAVNLLRVLPPEVAEQLLGRLDASVSGRLRAQIPAGSEAPSAEEIDAALSEFFDLFRIAERGQLFPKIGSQLPDGKSPTPGKRDSWSPPEPEEIGDPIAALRELPVDKLLKVLDGEPPPVVALVLTVLTPASAGAVLKGLPTEERAAVAVRFSQPGNRNYLLVQQLARAVVEKGKRLAEQPSETAPDARITDLAAMLRSLPRSDRIELFEKMNETDKQLSDRVKEKLFKFADVLKMDDRSLQGLLAQLNLKTIALALKDADEQLTTKVTNNISSRARELLQEEIGLLGSVAAAQVEEARKEVVTLIRQGEEEGKFVISE
jgi:flagellar motor switch protein FliG